VKKKTKKQTSKPATRGGNWKKQPPPGGFKSFELFPEPPMIAAGKSANTDELSAAAIIARINERCKNGIFPPALYLVDLAVGIIGELERLTKTDLWRIRIVAGRRVTWPVLAGRHTATHKKNNELFEKIGLAREADASLDLNEVPINLTAAKKWAIALIRLVERIRYSASCSELIFSALAPTEMTDVHLKHLRSYIHPFFTPAPFQTVYVNWEFLFEAGRLPDLTASPACVKRWQTAVWNLLLLNSGNQPAEIPELCGIGEHRRFHPYSAKLDLALKMDLVPLEKQKRNIFKEIETNIKDQVRQIAQHVDSLKPAPQ
jgi:hypothetical protein